MIKNTSYLAGTRLVKFLAGIFRSKINAIFLGTEGVGIVSQFLMIINTATDFTTLGMNEAVVKQIAQSAHENNRAAIASSIKTYLLTIIFFIFSSMIILFIFREDISFYVFGEGDFIGYFYLALFTFPLLIINGVFFAILKGFKAINHIAGARIGIIISNLLLFLPLVMMFKLQGAIAYLPLSFVITIIWNFYFARRYYLKPNELTFVKVMRAPIVGRLQREMLIFSGFGLIVSLLSVVSAFVGRSVVVTNLGIEKIGVYSPIVTWAGLFTGFLLPSFNTYLFPRFSEVKSNEEANGLINDALRLSTFCLLPMIFLATPFRYLLIQLFYSKEFLEAAEYLPYHFIGVIFNVWFVIFGQTMTPRGYIKQHSVLKSISLLISLSLALILVPRFGLFGWMTKFLAVYAFLFFVYYFFLRTKTNFALIKDNFHLMCYILFGAVLLIVVDTTIDYKWIGYVLGTVLLLISYFFLRTAERKFIKNKIRGIGFRS